MRRRPLVSGLLAGLLAAAAFSAFAGARNGTPQTGAELYERLTEAAAAGDRSASDYKQALDKYLEATGQGVSSLGLPGASAARRVAAGLVSLQIEDSAPWGIRVDNRTSLDTAAAVEAYRAVRTAALLGLSRKDAGRQIEVVISPSASLSPNEFASVLSCPCQTGELIVDVFTEDGWLMSSGRGFSGRELASSASDFEVEFLDQVSASLDLYPGVQRDDLRLEVRSVRLVMSAESARVTAAKPEVLLVDPLTDLSDSYAGRAAIVTVGNPPDVREAHARLVVGDPIDARFVEPGE
jgi:hypothetical protein